MSLKITFEPFGEQVKLVIIKDGKTEKILCKNQREAQRKAKRLNVGVEL